MRNLAPGETPRADETVSTFQNLSAHVIHISIGDGAFVTVPPTVGTATVVVALTAKEQTGLEAALATEAVQAWVTACELVLVAPPPPLPPDPDEGAGEGGSRRAPSPPEEGASEGVSKRRR